MQILVIFLVTNLSFSASDGEVENGEEAKAWLLRMKKYFEIYNYSDRLKSWMAIYNLTRKYDISWQDIKRVKEHKEKYLT